MSVGRKKQRNKTMKYIFGPVPSRRLGNSLGIDIIPPKTCSLDCVYCECGKTSFFLNKPTYFFNPKDILAELDEVLRKLEDFPIDYITFSGAGEPTLNKSIGYLISKIKEKYSYPVCVITNSTMLIYDEIKNALLKSDAIMPSLNTIYQETFEKLNRPTKGIYIKNIIESLIDFSSIYEGKFLLEIFLLKGYNDNLKEIEGLKSILPKIKYTEVHLNTLVRPGTLKNIKGLTEEELREVKKLLSLPNVKTVGHYNPEKFKKLTEKYIYSLLKETLQKRPCSMEDLVKLTEENPATIEKYIYLIEKKENFILKEEAVNGKLFFFLQRR